MNLEQQRALALARARQRAAEAGAEPSLEATIMAQPADFGPDGIPSVPFTDVIGPEPADERSLAGRAMDFVVGDDPARAFRIGAQGALRGVAADIPGLPIDMVTALANAGVDVVGLGASAFGAENPLGYVPNDLPFSSDWLAERGSDIAGALGIPVEDVSALSGTDLLGYNVSRFGAGAGAGSSGFAARANRTARPTRPADTGAGRLADALTDPYRGAGQGRTVAADIGGGAGAGAGITAAQGVDVENPYGRAALDTTAALVGGLGGAGATAGLTRGFTGVRDVVGGSQPDPSLPFLPDGRAVSNRVADMAARLYQDQAVNPTAASQVLDRRLNAALREGDPMPTSGIGSDDLGLIGLERELRSNPNLGTRFAVSDEALENAAMDRVGGLRDPDADFAAPARETDAQIASILGEAEANVATARAAFDEASANLQAVQSGEARGQTIRSALAQAENAARDVETAAWRNIQGQADPAPLAEAVQRVTDSLPMGRLDAAENIQQTVNIPARLMARIGEGGTVSLEEITSMRSRLTTAQRQARSAGDNDLANVIGRYVDEVDNYLGTAPGLADAVAEARRISVDVNDRFNRPGTAIGDTLASGSRGAQYASPDSSVASRFVRPDEGQASEINNLLRESGETVTPGQRAGADVDAPRADGPSNAANVTPNNREAVREALRDQLLSNVDKRRLLENPTQLERFIRQHSQVFDRFPDLRDELGTAAGLRRTLREAEVEARALERDLNSPRNVLRMVSKEADARDLAGRIFGSNRFGGVAEVRKINAALADNPEAMRGWKAAVTETLNARVTKASNGEINPTELNRIYQQHRDALAEIYTPQEMTTLDRAGEILEPLANLSRGVRGGSTTVPAPEFYSKLEAALLASGRDAITTGMIVARVRKGAGLLGLEKQTAAYKVAQLIQMAQFDPKLAKHLLEAPVSEGTSAAWSQNLQSILAGAQGARAFNDREEEPGLEDLIME
jgi:hypothetical protein